MKLNTWMTNGFDKFADETPAPAETVQSYRLCMAKNEAEGCQIAFRADTDVTCTLTCTGLSADAPSLLLLKEYTVKTGNLHNPDALAPFDDTLSLKADTTSTVYLRFTSTARTPAGDYTCSLLLKQGEATVQSYTVLLHVWNFALPESLSCATAVGLSKEYMTKMHGIQPGKELDRLYQSYYDFLLGHKVSAYTLPFDILDTRADAYMSDPRVTSFCVPYCENDDEMLKTIYAKLSSDPVWKQKAYFYPLDEPTDVNMLHEFEAMSERLNRLAPGIAVCTPFYRNIEYSEERDQISFMTGKTTLWCPKTYMYITSNIYSEKQMKQYPPFADRMAERKAAGDRVWWYVCWEPGDPYNNMFVDQKGVQHRILFWQQYAHDVDGFLYWSSDYWAQTESPWLDMATLKTASPDVYGDGSLLYNGNHVGINGACGSMRLEAIRDGIEDFDLLKLAEKLLGRAWVDAQVARVTPNLIEYSLDSNLFVSVRNEICAAIEKAMQS